MIQARDQVLKQRLQILHIMMVSKYTCEHTNYLFGVIISEITAAQVPESDTGLIEVYSIVSDHAPADYEDIDGPRSNCISLRPTDLRNKDYNINQPHNPSDTNGYVIQLQTLPRV